MARHRTDELSTNEWAVLALLAEKPNHGFALAKELAPDGAIGQIWTLPRPLVYRALEVLQQLELVHPERTEPGHGPKRTVLTTTPRGKKLVVQWLRQPVKHVRDARSLLMLKLVFLDRAGLDPAPLLRAQHALLVGSEDFLRRRERAASGFEHTLALWRLESTRALIRFVEALLRKRGTKPGAKRSA